MKIVIQRSDKSSVFIDNQIVNSIDYGLVILVGFHKNDTESQIDYLIKKIINLRIFEDNNHIMNKSIIDIKGSVLSISQFTLYASLNNGNRPSYKDCMKREDAIILYEIFNKKLSQYCDVKMGVFGADMTVNIVNSGPVTIVLEG